MTSAETLESGGANVDSDQGDAVPSHDMSTTLTTSQVPAPPPQAPQSSSLTAVQCHSDK